MSFEKGDAVVLNDKHSDYDGEAGEITQVSETMFGDENYSISFEDGKEHGVPADSLEAADEEKTDDDADEE
ncbi:DUF1918 domain-containing protein [Halovenus rubra]|uniref:DUF1918 domain-containing protein n=2 Tax=Halovenus rubra TaxID=869890 RepID=A0ABD5X416_9EURY|nr:DUF1918 domain-containing protein [Halovenus rubra]